MQLSENELVTLLLCSDLAVGDVSPLSDSAYSAFATALYKENRQPSDLFSMSCFLDVVLVILILGFRIC